MSLFQRIARLVLRPRLPRREGAVRVAGARGRITIGRDAWGIPSIDAGDPQDAWFGLGLCHAQDRGGQLEIMLRVVRGALAEVAGKDALPIDRLSRRLGIRAAGAAQLAVADADIRAQLEAYAAGINAGASVTRRAHEHVLLGIRPTPWTGADVQALATLLCFALASNWDVELVRWELARAHGVDALVALDPASRGADAALGGADPGAAIGALRAEIQALTEVLGLGGGSNAWALAAERTATGRPILCGDPHLPPQAPNPFYLARLECPEFLAVGATFPGIGAMATGHNGHLAWGITAAHLDTTDWFVEELGPDGASVRRGDRFVPCAVRREEVRVKGRRAPVIEDVVVTSHGPIVGAALDRMDAGRGEHGGGVALALAATWLAPRPYRGLLGVHLARDVASFRACFSQASTTNVGVVFAAAPTDDAPRGRIGLLFAAEVPVRKRGTGPLPQPGWDERHGWDGLVPADALPFVVDPPEGFVAAANAPPPEPAGAPPDGQAPFLGVDFLDDYRLRAITRALAARGEWDVAACQRLQIDTRSLPWEALREPVLAALGGGPVYDRLAGWDGHMAAGSVPATVFAHLVATLCRRVVHAKAPGGDAAEAALGRGATTFLPHNLLFARRVSHLVGLVVAQPDGWFAEGWPRVICDAAFEAQRQIVQRAGPDPTDWAWGRVRPLTLKHPFGDRPLLARLFDLGPYPIGGDATTIPQASLDLRAPAANPIGIASLRMVIDVGDWDRSTFILAGGQSGNPFSPHAADQVPRWLEADGVPIHTSREARARAVTHTLVVEPA